MASVAARLDPGWRRWARPGWLAGWNPAPFPLDGGDTELVETGDGPPLLLLPPLPGYKEAWIAAAPALARRFRVVTFDLRAEFAGPPRWEALVDDVARVVAERAGGRAIVAGHSLGGALALRFAIAHPAAVRGLVLSSAFRRVTTPAAQVLRRFVEQPAVLAALRTLPEAGAVRLAARLARARRWVLDPACDEHVCGLMVRGIRTAPLGLLRARLALALALEVRDAGTVRAPALALWGEHDTAFAAAESAALAREIPGAGRAVSPGAGHLHPLSNPEWFATTVAEWAAGLA